MKTLILNGSPRKNGDTAALLRVLTDRLCGDYRIIEAYRRAVSPCLDCRFCREHAGCRIQDGMQDIYRAIAQSDHILIASPVYFSTLPGTLLNLGSRLQAWFCARHFRKERPVSRPKTGAVILTGGGSGGLEAAYHTACLMLREMNVKEIFPLVSSGKTDLLPAGEDAAARAGVLQIADYFNQSQM